jgi:hypothetical protein
MKSWRDRIGYGLLAVAILMAASCGGSDEAEPAEESDLLELKSYSVPEGFNRDEWFETLKNVAVGPVTRGPSDTLVVLTSPKKHEGIRKMFEDLESRGPAVQSAPQSISVIYWVLLGKPIEVEESQYRVAPGQAGRLKNLHPVLTEIASLQGPLEYHLLEQLQLTAIQARADYRMRGRSVTVNQRVIDDDSTGRIIDVDLSISGNRGVAHTLASRVVVKPGEFVVLGQTTYDTNYVIATESD